MSTIIPRVKLFPDNYQEMASRTVNSDMDLANCGLGLAGEAGEAVDHIKKHIYHGQELKVEDMSKELGDILWYIAATATLLGLSLEDIMHQNIDKLKARYPDGFELGGGNR